MVSKPRFSVPLVPPPVRPEPCGGDAGESIGKSLGRVKRDHTGTGNFQPGLGRFGGTGAEQKIQCGGSRRRVIANRLRLPLKSLRHGFARCGVECRSRESHRLGVGALVAVAVPVAGRLSVPRIVPEPLTSSVVAGVVVLMPIFAVVPVPD